MEFLKSHIKALAIQNQYVAINPLCSTYFDDSKERKNAKKRILRDKIIMGFKTVVNNTKDIPYSRAVTRVRYADVYSEDAAPTIASASTLERRRQGKGFSASIQQTQAYTNSLESHSSISESSDNSMSDAVAPSTQDEQDAVDMLLQEQDAVDMPLQEQDAAEKTRQVVNAFHLPLLPTGPG